MFADEPGSGYVNPKRDDPFYEPPKPRGPSGPAGGARGAGNTSAKALGAAADVIGGIKYVADKASRNVPKSATMAGGTLIKYGVPGMLVTVYVVDVSDNMYHGDSLPKAALRAGLTTAGGQVGALVGTQRCVTAFGPTWVAVGCSTVAAPVGARFGEKFGDSLGTRLLGPRPR